MANAADITVTIDEATHAALGNHIQAIADEHGLRVLEVRVGWEECEECDRPMHPHGKVISVELRTYLKRPE